MSLVSMLKGRGPSGFGYGSTAEEVTDGLDLTGRTMLVTGGNSGLGLETARVLALRGARVLATGRTVEKVRAATESFVGEIVPVACDLAVPESVRSCVEEVRRDGARLDAIICNAGIMALPKLEQAHGCELQFFTNHIGHFLLVTGLLDRLADKGRVVMVSSSAYNMAPKGGIQLDNLSGEKGYNPWKEYGQSKLANVLFARELARRLEGSGKTANALHPGVIQTNLGRSMPGLFRGVLAASSSVFLKSAAQGAATQVYVATHPSIEGVGGAYFADCNRAKLSRRAEDMELAAKLWAESERIVANLP
jgi:WW domain-containing oxidoreductase